MLAATALAQPVLAQPAAERPGFYTTKESNNGSGDTLPWLKKPETPADASGKAPAQFMPFQRMTPYGSQPVSGPLPMDRAVPVENIDGVEMSAPAAPVDTRLVADPAKEDPAAPTELTSPMFAADADTKSLRIIVLRVLNKVTARAEELKARPGETIQFGRLQVEAQQCYQSALTSQHDTVALVQISEKIAGQPHPKLLFHGWMYASSPSLTALEHPIYDVTMVDCQIKGAEAAKPADALKKEDRSKAKADKPDETDAPGSDDTVAPD